MAINQKKVISFLKSYNELEKTLSESDAEPSQTVLMFEDSLANKDVESQQKIKVCRIVRNYIQHNDSFFIEPSTEMILFLENVTNNIKSLELTAGKAMRKLSPLKLSDTIQTASKKLVRNKVIPVVDKNNICIGLVTDVFIRNALANDAKPSSKIALFSDKLIKARYVTKETFVKNISEPSIVTKDGKASGKYLGVVFV